MSDAESVGGSQIRFDGVTTMTEQQKRDYKLYRAACLMSNVEPVRADFLAGDIPSCVQHQLVLQKPRAFATTA